MSKRQAGYVVQIACLLFLCILQSYTLFLIFDEFGGADDQDQAWKDMLARLGVVIAMSLSLTFILLVWSVIRWTRTRLESRLNFTPAEYIDAWSEAGRRIDAIDADVSANEEDEEEP